MTCRVYCFVFRIALRYCSSETPGGKRELPTWQSHVPAHLSAPNCAVSLPLCSKHYLSSPQQHRGFYLQCRELILLLQAGVSDDQVPKWYPTTSPTTALATTIRTSSFPPPSKDKGWVGGKILELLAAPGADQPLEALRVHLSPFLPLHYTLDRCKFSGWTSWLPKE